MTMMTIVMMRNYDYSNKNNIIIIIIIPVIIE